MEQVIKLSSKQKQDLRKIYASYKCAEDAQEREEVKNEVSEKFPELKGIFMFELPELIYSANQLQFIEDAEQTYYNIDYGYSGRGMYGDVCPSIVCESHNDLDTLANTQIDSMGLSIVIYAQY